MVSFAVPPVFTFPNSYTWTSFARIRNRMRNNIYTFVAFFSVMRDCTVDQQIANLKAVKVRCVLILPLIPRHVKVPMKRKLSLSYLKKSLKMTK